MDIQKEWIDSLAPNEAAAQNGRDLIRKGRFKNLRASADGTLLLGECAGSGKDDYAVSADFINTASPVFRCTCPSRQFPCKHALGLLYARAGGSPFAPCDIPPEILEKREKAARREEKKKEPPEEKPAVKRTNESALKKKIGAQIEGLEILRSIVLEIASAGLGLMNRQRADEYLEQSKQLGDHYVPGAQAALRGFLLLFDGERANNAANCNGPEELARLHALAAKGIEYLKKKAEDPSANIDTSSEMEDLLGNAWQFSQLRELGRTEKDVELVELAFRSFEDGGAQEYIDEGLWVNLTSGAIVRTVNRRPFKAARHIREDDSFFLCARVPELAVYPGPCNPRVRWEEMEALELTEAHIAKILSYANPSFADAVKAARNVLKNPLGLRFPAALLRFSRIGTVGGDPAIESPSGERLTLGETEDYPQTIGNLQFLSRRQLESGALLGVFHQQPGGGALRLHPLTVVWPGGIVRLAY